MTLQQGSEGYTGCADTYLHRYDADRNFCELDVLRIGIKQQYEDLIRFDLASVPANVVVLQATLELHATGWDGSNQDIELYRVLRAVNICQATWNQAAAGNPWAEPGGNDPTSDRGASPEDSVSTSGIDKWYAFDVTALVQDWVVGVPNNGVLLRSASPTSTSHFRFASAEYSVGSLRPRLVIRYRTGGVPVATATPTPTATTTSTRTLTPTPTPTVTPSATPSSTAPPSGTTTPTATPTRTGTPTRTATPTATGLPTPTPTVTSTPVLPGAEVTVTLQQGSEGYSGSQDTYIYRYDADANFSRQDVWRVGYKQHYSGLLRFELPSLPAGVQIRQALLHVFAYGWDGVDLILEVYRVLQDVEVDEATWNQAAAGNPWFEPGCNDPVIDRPVRPEDVFTTQGVDHWYMVDLTSLVQDWVSGAQANNGVLVRPLSQLSTSMFRFASAEYADASLRPKLKIIYKVPSGPTPTPPGSLTVSGMVYDNGSGPTQPVAGVNVGVRMCVPISFPDVTGPDGRYTIMVPGHYLNACTEVTLDAWTTGYDIYSQVISVADLRASPVRNIGLVPVHSPTPTTVLPYRIDLPIVLRSAP